MGKIKVISDDTHRLTAEVTVDLSDYCHSYKRVNSLCGILGCAVSEAFTHKGPASSHKAGEAVTFGRAKVLQKLETQKRLFQKERAELLREFSVLLGCQHWLAVRAEIARQCDKSSKEEACLHEYLSQEAASDRPKALVLECLAQSFIELIKNSVDAILRQYLIGGETTILTLRVGFEIKDSNLSVTLVDNAGGIPKDYLMGYEIKPLTDTEMAVGTLYVRETSGKIHYRVIAPSGEPASGIYDSARASERAGRPLSGHEMRVRLLRYAARQGHIYSMSLRDRIDKKAYQHERGVSGKHLRGEYYFGGRGLGLNLLIALLLDGDVIENWGGRKRSVYDVVPGETAISFANHAAGGAIIILTSPLAPCKPTELERRILPQQDDLILRLPTPRSRAKRFVSPSDSERLTGTKRFFDGKKTEAKLESTLAPDAKRPRKELDLDATSDAPSFAFSK